MAKPSQVPLTAKREATRVSWKDWAAGELAPAASMAAELKTNLQRRSNTVCKFELDAGCSHPAHTLLRMPHALLESGCQINSAAACLRST